MCYVDSALGLEITGFDGSFFFLTDLLRFPLSSALCGYLPSPQGQSGSFSSWRKEVPRQVFTKIQSSKGFHNIVPLRAFLNVSKDVLVPLDHSSVIFYDTRCLHSPWCLIDQMISGSFENLENREYFQFSIYQLYNIKNTLRTLNI